MLLLTVASFYAVSELSKLRTSLNTLHKEIEELKTQQDQEKAGNEWYQNQLKRLERQIDSLTQKTSSKEINYTGYRAAKNHSKSTKKSKARPSRSYWSGTHRYQGIRFTIFTVSNLHRTNLNFFHNNEKNQLIGSIAKLDHYTAQRSQKLVFATNGGIFTPSYQPEGLFIDRGKLLYPINLESGAGNFFLKPNGVFFLLRNGKAFIRATQDFLIGYDSLPPIKYAMQSGPLLVDNGQIHPAFRKNAKSKYIRNGVGINREGQVIFAISEEPVNLYTFAAFFNDHMQCPDALYLDGAISKMYISQIHQKAPFGKFAVLIGITEDL